MNDDSSSTRDDCDETMAHAAQIVAECLRNIREWREREFAADCDQLADLRLPGLSEWDE